MRVSSPNGNALDSRLVALMALGWILQDETRARRLLDLTGLDPAALRAGASDPVVLAAILSFLEAHEPDLLACADALALSPDQLVTARKDLAA